MELTKEFLEECIERFSQKTELSFLEVVSREELKQRYSEKVERYDDLKYRSLRGESLSEYELEELKQLEDYLDSIYHKPEIPEDIKKLVKEILDEEFYK